MNNIEFNKGLISCRIAGKYHREIKKELKENILCKNLSLLDLANFIETKIKKLIRYDNLMPLKKGIAFPTGLSMNNCAAHWTPELTTDIKLGKEDIIKIDFGIHYGGYIIDSAFSYSMSPKFDLLIQASREATREGIKNAGADAYLGDIGSDIQEVIESFEVEIDNKVYRVKPMYDLCGHSIKKYNIHAGKSVPCIRLSSINKYLYGRMKENEFYAIETFATTGNGKSKYTENCSHFMINNYEKIKKKKTKLSNNIVNNYFTLPFCTRWLDTELKDDYRAELEQYCSENLINKYRPIYDIKGSYISHHEETIAIHPNKIEILS